MVNNFIVVDDGIVIFEDVGSTARRFDEAILLNIDSVLDYDFPYLRCASVRLQGE